MFDGCAQSSAMKFEEEIFCVQLHNLLMGCMDEERGMQIGGSVGKVMEVDVSADGVGWGRFLRVRVVISLQKPIARGRLISINGTSVWVSFKYEKLPRMCFSCRWIVHGVDGCVRKENLEGEVPQFGTWLRANWILRSGGWNHKSKWEPSAIKRHDPEIHSEGNGKMWDEKGESMSGGCKGRIMF